MASMFLTLTITLNHIHKTTLYLIEYEDAECHDNDSEGKTIGEVAPGEGSGTEESKFECFED